MNIVNPRPGALSEGLRYSNLLRFGREINRGAV
jgi:hypothetical protein